MNIVFVQGVQFLLVAVRNFEDSGSSENETLFICSLCLWWGSMIDATLTLRPEAMCKAVKDLANVLKGENQSRIRTRSGLKEEVCACVLYYIQYYLCSKKTIYVYIHMFIRT